MSFYFSTYKKKKIFPFSVFGYLAALVWTGLIIYFLQKGYSVSDLFASGTESNAKDLIGFSIIVSSFLIYFLNIGVTREIKTNFKFPLYLMQFLFLVISAASGYFLTSVILEDLIVFLVIIGTANYLTLIIYFLLQHRVYSRYYSFTVMIISSLPIIPFLYGIIKMIFNSPFKLSGSQFSFDNIALYVLLFTLLLYTTVNSIYMSYINRRVF